MNTAPQKDCKDTTSPRGPEETASLVDFRVSSIRLSCPDPFQTTGHHWKTVSACIVAAGTWRPRRAHPSTKARIVIHLYHLRERDHPGDIFPSGTRTCHSASPENVLVRKSQNPGTLLLKDGRSPSSIGVRLLFIYCSPFGGSVWVGQKH
nr:hypothetical protein CFP56_37066 [Quercus suber]